MDHETTDDIIREMRRCADNLPSRQKNIPKLSILAWRNLADRIEAAAKREASEAELKWSQVGYEERMAEEKKRKSSSAASMREALRGVRQYVRIWIGTDVIDRTMAERIIAMCDAAIAGPACNCDVGTAEEQGDRFAKEEGGPECES